MENNELLQAIGVLIDDRLQPIKMDLSSLKEDVSGLKEDVSGLKEDVSELKLRTGALEQAVGSMDRRTENLEITVTQIDDRTRRMEILMEHDIPKQIKLLEEGHAAMAERLPGNDEMREVRLRVSTLEHVAIQHTADIALLKKAN